MVGILIANADQNSLQAKPLQELGHTVKILRIIGVQRKANESYLDYVMHAAKHIAKSLAQKLIEGNIDKIDVVLGYETVGLRGGIELRAYANAQNAEAAASLLFKNSEQKLTVMTGVHVINPITDEFDNATSITHVVMAQISSNRATQYFQKDSTYHARPLGFEPIIAMKQGLIAKVEGSVSNLFYNLPTEDVVKMIERVA